MSTTLERTDLPETVDVFVSDLTRQQKLHLEEVGVSTAAAEVAGWSKARMALAPDVEFVLRDDSTARLLNPQQPVGELAREGRVELTLQPDARLG